MHFDWTSYCESEGARTVPEEALPHYVSSLTTALSPGSLLELQTAGQWRLGVVRLVCDPLVQLSLLDIKDTKQSSDLIWVNTENIGLFKYGHCRDTASQEKEVEVEWYQWCEENQLTELYPPLQQSFPAGSGLSPLTRLRAGQQFELQEASCPRHYWRVTVTQNTAGILGLSLDSPGQTAITSSSSTDLHLHLLDERLQPCGTVQATNLASFSRPESLSSLECPEQLWSDLQESFTQSPGESSSLSWAPEPLKKHKFEERMLLAVIDPHSQDRFRVAIVERVLDQFYFEICLLEQAEVKIVCNSRSLNLVHLAWAIGEKFLAKAALQNMPCSKLSKVAPKHLFNIMDRTVPTAVEVGQNLEFCSSFSEKMFHLAHVVGIRGHILILEVWTENGKETKLTPVKNLHLFPAGFAEANSFKFYIPKELRKFTRDQDEVSQVHNDSKADDGTMKADNTSDDLKPSFLVRPLSNLEGRDTSWCPPIYFNHLCYSASFLSKHRLESLPRFIGSGPVRLVMREVLSRLIGASFKSGAVLKKLEVSERRPDYWLEPMKGKSRVLALQADIEIPSLTWQVAGFCREVCQKLSCCPYLFGPQRVGEECPSACNSRPKSDFQAEGETAFKIVRRGRRGRKRQKVVVSSEKGDGGGGESSNAESGTSSPSCSNTVTTNTTRDNSPDQTEGSAKRKNKNWGDILPPSEMKTRGAKLPSFSMQLKKR